MGFLQKIEEDLKTALKAKDALRLSVLRMVKSSLKNREIELIRPVTEPEFIEVLSKLVKQRGESAEQYTKGGREDLAANELSEANIIKEYLPKALSDEELVSIIAAAKIKVGATGPQDMGKIMKEIKDATAGRVDGKILAERVKAALQ